MATESGTQDLDVSRSLLGAELQAEPGRFDFFQAVRLLRRLKSEREAIKFSVKNQLAFPTSQIAAIDWMDGEEARVEVNFIGLTGPMGVLPHSYTELIQERKRAKDRALADFLNLFNHRIIELFYEAWEKYRFYVPYERRERDRFSQHMMSLVGLGTAGLERRQPVADESYLYYCGLFSMQARSGAALEQILQDYFGVAVEVEQFVGAWRAIERDNQCRIEGGTPYSDQLGMGALAGDRVWDLQSRARIKLGPLTARQYLAFLPAGDAWKPLRAVTAFFAGGEIEFEVQLVLRRGEVPPCALKLEEEDAPRLGWFSWIKSRTAFAHDPGDTVLLLN